MSEEALKIPAPHGALLKVPRKPINAAPRSVSNQLSSGRVLQPACWECCAGPPCLEMPWSLLRGGC